MEMLNKVLKFLDLKCLLKRGLKIKQVNFFGFDTEAYRLKEWTTALERAQFVLFINANLIFTI